MKGIDGLTPKQKAAVEAQARLIAADRRKEELESSVAKLSEWLENPGDGETYVTQLTVKPNWGDDGDCFVIMKALIGGEKRIAFHGGNVLSDAIIGVMKRLLNGTMKWKEDKPYDSTDSG